MGHKRPGFTLIELTMAITITAVIGLSVAGVAMTLSRAHQHSQAFQQSVQSGRCVMRNIGRTIRQAKLMTACQDHCLILWADDADSDGQISPSELVAIYYDPELQEIRELTLDMSSASQALRDVLDVPVPLQNVTNASYTKGSLSESTYKTDRVLASRVTSARFYVDTDPPLTKAAGLVAIITRNGRAVAFRTVVATRAGFEQYVGVSDGDYVLMPVY